MNIVSIDPDKRSVLMPLFANYRPQRIFINSVLEGHSGIALADSKTNPRVAQLTHPGWAILGGDVTHPIAQKLVQQLSEMWIIPISEAWRALIFQVHGHHLKQMQRHYVFPRNHSTSNICGTSKNESLLIATFNELTSPWRANLEMKGFPVSPRFQFTR